MYPAVVRTFVDLIKGTRLLIRENPHYMEVFARIVYAFEKLSKITTILLDPQLRLSLAAIECPQLLFVFRKILNYSFH